MVKLDHNGQLSTGIMGNKKSSISLFNISYINRKIEIDHSKGDKLIIFDMKGQTVLELKNHSSKMSFNFNVEQGIYIFSLYNNSELIESKKLFIPSEMN